MSRAEKRKPLPHDAEAAAQGAERRETLAANTDAQRLIRVAQATELKARRDELTGAFGDLRRMKHAAGRGNFAAALAGYDRVYKRIERLAGMIAGMIGAAVEVPAYDPPQEASGGTRMIGVPEFDRGLYTEHGPRPGAIPPAIPGSAHDWTETK